ncbi:hypothetical protein SLE2022_153020 [Rubroshorea leprosula]
MEKPSANDPTGPNSRACIPDTLLHSFENLHLNNGIGSRYAAFPYNASLTTSGSRNGGMFLGAPNLQHPTEGFHPSINRVGGYGANCHQNLTSSHAINVAPVPRQNIIFLAALTPEGSETLNQYLSSKNSPATDIIFEAVIDSIFELMTDQAGHCVFGNLIHLCNKGQLHMIVKKLEMHPEAMAAVCINRYGSPSVKKLIKLIAKSDSDSLATSMVEGLYKVFNQLMVHKTGCHVIVQCLETLSINHNELLHIATIENALYLATHVNGCLALNSVIDVIKGPRRNELLESIADLAVCLSQDPYGNFVVQNLLGLQYPNITKKICSLLKDHYIRISMLKGGSHVVEKCLKSTERGYAVEAFMECQGQALVNVARDQFGNYVIQTALKETKHADRALHDRLVMKLRSHLVHLERRYGRNVLNLIVNQDSY